METILIEEKEVEELSPLEEHVVVLTSYESLSDKPSINNVELIGDKSLEDLGIFPYDDSEVKQDINNLDIEVDNLTDNMNKISVDVNTHTEEINQLEQAIERNIIDITGLEVDLNHLDDKKVDYKDVYTKQQVDDLISSVENVKIQVVDDLPEIGETNIIYFVHRPNPDFDDVYNEYIWENNQYELIGNTLIDLSDYVTHSKLNYELNEYYTKEQIDENNKQFATTVELINAKNSCEPKLANSVDYSFQQISYGNGESGYRKYKNGMLEQWGVTTSNANGDSEFTMHQPHIDQNFSIFIEPREQGNFFHYAIPSGNQKFRCRIQSRDSISMAIKFQWRSWGRWK